MAHEIKLEIYSLKVRKKYSGKDDPEYQTLGNLSGSNFLDFAANFCKDFSVEPERNNQQKRTFRVDSEHLSINSGKRVLSGLINCGTFGIGSNIVAPDGTIAYKKSVDDSDEMPFFFLMYLPPNSELGIIMLQRFGGAGLQSIFKINLFKYFGDVYPDYRIEIEPMLTKSLYKSIVEHGEANTIVLRRHNLPKDVTDNSLKIKFETKIKYLEIKLVPEGGSFGREFMKFFKEAFDNNETRLLSSPALDELGLDSNAHQYVWVKTGKEKRKIDLQDHMKIKPYYNIDHKVEKNELRHPYIWSIREEAESILEDLITEITGKVESQ